MRLCLVVQWHERIQLLHQCECRSVEERLRIACMSAVRMQLIAACHEEQVWVLRVRGVTASGLLHGALTMLHGAGMAAAAMHTCTWHDHCRMAHSRGRMQRRDDDGCHTPVRPHFVTDASWMFWIYGWTAGSRNSRGPLSPFRSLSTMGVSAGEARLPQQAAN